MGYNWAEYSMENNKKIQNKRQKSRLIFLLCLASILLSSCAISNSFSVGDSRYLDLYHLQDLEDNEILAVYAEEDNYNTVKIITYGHHYAPLGRIQGNFTCVDFWTYETVQGEIRTIPVFVKTTDYEKYRKGH